MYVYMCSNRPVYTVIMGHCGGIVCLYLWFTIGELMSPGNRVPL